MREWNDTREYMPPGRIFIVADPICQEIAIFGYYSSYDEAQRRCQVLNRRPGAPGKNQFAVCQLVAIEPPCSRPNGDPQLRR